MQDVFPFIYLKNYFNSAQFLMYKSLIFVLHIAYKNFIFLGIHVNVIIFLISFLDSFLLMYRNAAFLLLILYHAAFTEFANSKIFFFVESLEFLAYTNMSSANRDEFTSSCQIQMPLICFSFLIVFLRNFSTLKLKWQTGYPFFVLHLEKKL